MRLIMMIKSQRRRGLTELEGEVISASIEREIVIYRQQEEEEDMENSGEMTIEVEMVEMVTICHPRVIAKTVTMTI